MTGHCRRACVAAMLSAAACPGAAAAQPATLITNGIAALGRRDVRSAVRFFSQAAVADTGAVASTAERWLGHLAWQVKGDRASATMHLDRARKAGGDTSMIQLERARLLEFERSFADAIALAHDVMRGDRDGERRGLAARTLIDVAMTDAFAMLRAGGTLEDSVQIEGIGEALDTLRMRVKRFPGRTADALALIEAGALLRDTADVIQGWESYSLLEDDSTRSATARRSRDNDRRTAPALLASSGLYEPAAILLEYQREAQGADANSNDGDLRHYGVFVHDVRAAVEGVYRREVSGTARPGDLQRAMNVLTRKLWSELHWSGAAPPYYPAEVPIELGRRFGAVISTDDEAGLAQLRFSHVLASFVEHDRARHLSPRFVVLDGVVSNGIDPWLLGSGTGRAGWVAGDSIYEIRTSFTEEPFREWTILADPQRMAVERVRLERETAADVERARHDSTAFLPGVAARLFHEGSRQILDSLFGLGLSPVEQQSAFTTVLFRQLNETTIRLHETRHFIDAHALHRPLSVDEAEFRAKIDEVAGSGHPRLALTAILHPNIGDATAHGRANHRIMLNLIRWMRANAGAIDGFDRSSPALVQLPLLTDAQLHAAFESMRSAG